MKNLKKFENFTTSFKIPATFKDKLYDAVEKFYDLAIQNGEDADEIHDIAVEAKSFDDLMKSNIYGMKDLIRFVSKLNLDLMQQYFIDEDENYYFDAEDLVSYIGKVYMDKY